MSIRRNDEEFEKVCREEADDGHTVIVGRQLVAPWSSYMEIHPMAPGKIWVRWCGVDGIYRWLHPDRRVWVEEPDQIDMPTFTDYASARIAADNSPEPPTWGDVVLHQDQPR